jgi:hypothetical protein
MGQLRRRAISARHAPGCSAWSQSASPKLFVSSKVARPPSDDKSCAVGPFLRAVTGTWGNLSQRHQVGHRLHDTGTPTRTPAQMPQRIEPPGGYRLPRSLAHATTGRVIRCAALRAIYVSAVVHCSAAEARALASLSLRAIAVNPRANPRSAPSVPLPALTHRQTQAPCLVRYTTAWRLAGTLLPTEHLGAPPSLSSVSASASATLAPAPPLWCLADFHVRRPSATTELPQPAALWPPGAFAVAHSHHVAAHSQHAAMHTRRIPAQPEPYTVRESVSLSSLLQVWSLS